MSKHLADDEFLLQKNSIIHTDKSIRSAPLEDYLSQQPTPKFLGFFYSNVGIYYALKDKKSGFDRWLMKLFGTEPVFLDKFAAQESARQMKSFLYNLSYFNAEIDINYNYKGKKVVGTEFASELKLVDFVDGKSTTKTIQKIQGK